MTDDPAWSQLIKLHIIFYSNLGEKSEVESITVGGLAGDRIAQPWVNVTH